MNFLHKGRMEPLPTFDTLIAFDAVARHGSVNKAAAEIGITQSAVSHRLRRLQDFMGVKLYERTADGLVINAAGRALRADVGDLLARAAELRSRCIDADAPDRLRLGVSAALGDNWLMRRLPGFAARHPGISVEVSTLENAEAERTEQLDVRILWLAASEARASSVQRPLFREHVFPVCTPELLRRSGAEAGVKGLLSLPLLQKTRPGGQGEEWEWETWFTHLGLKDRPNIALSLTALGPTVSSALAGSGVALARTIVVCDALADGRLVRVLAPELDRLSSKVHVVRWSARHIGNAHVRAFADWIVEEARLSATSSVTPRRLPIDQGGH